MPRTVLLILYVNDYHARHGSHQTAHQVSEAVLGDLGVALHLTENAQPGGPHLENLVLTDLLAWRDARLERAEVFYWRTAIGEEVDFVIETGGQLLPIEVKATKRPRLAEAATLRTFRAEYGKKARAGLLLHTGTTLEWLAPDVLAAPWHRVL
jgi:predicted AAA+ superfamily ATPase